MGLVGEMRTLRAGSGVDRTSWMLTSLLLWLCSLPLVGLIVLPWLGARIALIVAAALLAFAVTACYAICTWQDDRPRQGSDGE